MNRVESWVSPVADWLSSVVFFALPLAEVELPLVVLWLIAGAFYFTFRFRFVAFWGFTHALRLVSNKHTPSSGPGEVTHFQALTTAMATPPMLPIPTVPEIAVVSA